MQYQGARRLRRTSLRTRLVVVTTTAFLTGITGASVAGAADVRPSLQVRNNSTGLVVVAQGFPPSSRVGLTVAAGNCSGESAVTTTPGGTFTARLAHASSCPGTGTVTARSAKGTATGRYGQSSVTPSPIVDTSASQGQSGPRLEQIGWITGPKSANRTDKRFGVTGTDLGVMWDRGDGNVLVAFGDSFGGAWKGHGTAPGRDDWRRNWVVTSSTRDLDQGMNLTAINGSNNRVPELLHAERGELTVIPTTGIAYKGRQYMHYMAVKSWGKPGTWVTTQSGVAVSGDGGSSWQRTKSARIPNEGGDNPFQVLSLAWGPDRKMYAFGTPNGRFGNIHLARIDGAPDDIGSWKFWTGERWAEDMDDARAVANGPAGEPSVAWHQGLQKWIMLYLDEKQAAIVLRTAPKASGPWTDTQVVASGKQYPGLYGAFIHPWSLQDPTALYFTMSQWDPYNVELMKTDLTAYAPATPSSR